MANKLKLIRRNEVLEKLRISKTTLFNRIKAGLIPAPVGLGGRAVAWPEHEIDEVIKALISGRSSLEIQTLVINLKNERKTFF